MRRDWSSWLVLGVGVYLSLVAHCGGVVTFEVARKVWAIGEPHAPRRPRAPIEIAFDVPRPRTPVPASPQASVTPPEDPQRVLPTPPPTKVPPRTPTPPPVERQRVARLERARPERPRPERPRPEPPRPEPTKVQPPQPVAREQHMIDQRSDDPSVPDPENPRFLAQESRRVEDETVATVRNLHRDDPGPVSPGRPHRSADRTLGSDDDERAADLRDRDGDDRRAPTREETDEDRPRRAPSKRLPDAVARGDMRSRGTDRAARDQEPRAARPATPPGGGGHPATTPGEAGREPERSAPAEERGVDDQGGTVAVATGAATSRQGPTKVGQGAARPADSRRPGEPGEPGRRGQGRGRGSRGVDLRVSLRTFEETFGEEQLRTERDAYVRERRSHTKGSYARRWTRFRGAIENYVPFVRPGNQTALSAARSPFAVYLAGVHRRIHRVFADDFLASLDSLGAAHPMNDQDLVTKLEMVLNRDGTIHRVGVVETSGMLSFDFAAVDSVERGVPFPVAPEPILSGDGRVYIRWSFYRNQRACGTFNAEPYILPRPGERRRPPAGPTDDCGTPSPSGAPAGTPRPSAVPSDTTTGRRAVSRDDEEG